MTASRHGVWPWALVQGALWFAAGGATVWLVRGDAEADPAASETALVLEALREVDLSESQREQVTAILTDYQTDVGRVRDEYWADVHRLEARADEALVGVLDPAQRARVEGALDP